MRWCLPGARPRIFWETYLSCSQLALGSTEDSRGSYSVFRPHLSWLCLLCLTSFEYFRFSHILRRKFSQYLGWSPQVWPLVRFFGIVQNFVWILDCRRNRSLGAWSKTLPAAWNRLLGQISMDETLRLGFEAHFSKACEIRKYFAWWKSFFVAKDYCVA